MKGRFWRKALAASLALLIVTGSVPIKPISNVFDSMVVTAEAVEEVTKTYSFDTATVGDDRLTMSATDPDDSIIKPIILANGSGIQSSNQQCDVNSFLGNKTLSNLTGLDGAGQDIEFTIFPNINGKVTKIEFTKARRSTVLPEKSFSMRISGMKYNGTDSELTGVDAWNASTSITFVSSDNSGVKDNLSLILGAQSELTFTTGCEMIITYIPDEAPVHEHSFSFNATGNKLIATCANDDGLTCSLADSDYKATLMLTSDGGHYYPNVSYSALLNLGEFNALTGLNATAGEITYTNKETGAATTNYVRDFGDYTASVTITINGTDYNLTKDFSIYSITCNYTQFSFNCDDGIITATFTPINGESLETMTLTGNNTNLSIGNGINDNGNGTYTFAKPKESVTLSATLNFPENPSFTQNGNTYTINNADGWDYFCQRLEADGNGFSGKTIELAADISVTTMAGDGIYPFKGTFDGKGHTLDFRPTTATNCCAPFMKTNGATIRNLHATGQIEGGNWKYIGGLVGSADGDLTIENCRVSTQISSTVSGTAFNGGFVGLLSSQYNQCHITGCVFDGLIYNSNTWNQTYGCGGFVGCFSQYGYAILKDCLFIEGQYDNNNGKCELWWGNENDTNSTFLYRFNKQGEGTLTNCFYVGTHGLKQGSPAVESTTAPTNFAHFGAPTTDYGFLKVYGHTMVFDNKYYTPTYGDLVETYDFNGVKSYNIEYDDDKPLGIPDITTQMWVPLLRYKRTFTDGKPVTVMMPFNFTKSDFKKSGSSDGLTGHFYEFQGLQLSTQTSKWEPKLTKEVTTMKANTPYIYVPDNEPEYWYIDNDGLGVNIFTEGYDGGTKETEYNGSNWNKWRFVGTYEPQYWYDGSDSEHPAENIGELGKVYGIAGATKEVQGVFGNTITVGAGDFTRAHSDAKVRPTSGYFVWTGDEPQDSTSGSTSSSDSYSITLPDNFEIVSVTRNGEEYTGESIPDKFLKDDQIVIRPKKGYAAKNVSATYGGASSTPPNEIPDYDDWFA